MSIAYPPLIGSVLPSAAPRIHLGQNSAWFCKASSALRGIGRARRCVLAILISGVILSVLPRPAILTRFQHARNARVC